MKYVVALVILIIASCPIIAYGTKDNVTFTVKKTERINTPNASYYLVFTDRETFKNSDCIWYGKFNSSDIYGEIEAGKKYTADVYGFRVHFLSWYRNIINIKQIGGDK